MALVLEPLKAVGSDLQSAPQPLTRQPIYWLAWGLPLAMIGGQFVYQRRQRYLLENDAAVRRSRAYKQAQRALKRARKQAQDPDDTAGQILTAYLEAKLDCSIKGLTHPQLNALLQDSAVPEALAEHTVAILYAMDILRFGRGAAAGADIWGSTEACISELEKALA